MRNALAYAGKGQRQMVLALINTAFAQETPESARHNGTWSPINCVRNFRSLPT